MVKPSSWRNIKPNNETPTIVGVKPTNCKFFIMHEETYTRPSDETAIVGGRPMNGKTFIRNIIPSNKTVIVRVKSLSWKTYD